MRIAYLTPIGGLGGAERNLLETLKGLRELDEAFEPELISGSDGPLLEEARRLEVRCHLLKMPESLSNFGDSAFILGRQSRLGTLGSLCRRGTAAVLAAEGYRRRLQSLLRRLAPQVVHSNGCKFHLLTALARSNAPLVWHIHDFLGLRPLLGNALRLVSRGVSLTLGVSAAVVTDIRAVLPGVPVLRLPNGIDTSLFSPAPGDGQQLDVLAGLPPAAAGTVRVGLVAVYGRWKGQDVFLKAAAQLAQQSPKLPLRCYVIGGPIYQTDGSQFSQRELRALAAGLGLGKRVGFIPFQQDPAAIYRALDVVVHASTRPEPFGRALAEAMACGRPVIGSLSGGVCDVFTPDVDALGVPPNEPAALAAAVRTLAENVSLREKLAARARIGIRERMSHVLVGRELLSIYRQLVTSGGHQRQLLCGSSTSNAAA
jgi:glycosyltransferase involved in cell wall biosynthesis